MMNCGFQREFTDGVSVFYVFIEERIMLYHLISQLGKAEAATGNIRKSRPLRATGSLNVIN